MPEKKSVFQFHGIDVEPGVLGECPWCGKNKFKYSPETWLYGCHVCHAEGTPHARGNCLEFLRGLYAQTDTIPFRMESLEPLASERGLPWQAFHAVGIRPHPFIANNYLLPTFKHGKGPLVELHRIARSRGKWCLYASPAPPNEKWRPHLYVPKNQLQQDSEWVPESVMVCEGIWDTIALCWASLNRKSKDSLCAVVGIPGSANRCYEDLEQIAIRMSIPLVLLMDNDKAGREAQNGYLGRYQTHKISVIDWTGCDEGMDVSDLVRDNPPSKAYADVVSKIVPVERHQTDLNHGNHEGVDIHPHDDYDGLIQAIREEYHFDQVLEGALAFVLSLAMSTEILSDALWGRLIGPAGSGKTTIPDFFQALEKYVLPISQLTGLHSGFRNTGQDESMIARMDRKFCYVKEADVLLSNPNKDRILAQLRDVYDGRSVGDYLNGVHHRYDDLRITLLLCGTPSIRSLNRAHLGDRFLDYDIGEGVSERQNQILEKVVDRAKNAFRAGPSATRGNTALGMSKIQSLGCGYLRHLRESPILEMPEISHDDEFTLTNLAVWVSILRSIPEQANPSQGMVDYVGRLMSMIETPSRVLNQLVKLTLSLCVVLQSGGSPDERVWWIIRKTARDTAFSLSQRILLCLSGHERPIQDLHTMLELPVTTIRYCLGKLSILGLVQRRRESTGLRGNRPELWSLSSRTEKLIEDCGF